MSAYFNAHCLYETGPPSLFSLWAEGICGGECDWINEYSSENMNCDETIPTTWLFNDV